MNIKIEKGIKAPVTMTTKFPFGEMEVGDSFFFPGISVRTRSSQYGKKHGKKFISRAVEGGYRVWRVE